MECNEDDLGIFVFHSNCTFLDSIHPPPVPFLHIQNIPPLQYFFPPPPHSPAHIKVPEDIIPPALIIDYLAIQQSQGMGGGFSLVGRSKGSRRRRRRRKKEEEEEEEEKTEDKEREEKEEEEEKEMTN